MPQLEEVCQVALEILVCALLLMFTFSLAPHIPQLLGGTLLQRELARIWGVTNLVLVCEILRKSIVFAYYMLLMVGNIRLVGPVSYFICLYM